MLSLLLVLLVGIAGRAEASVINVRPFFSVSAFGPAPNCPFVSCLLFNEVGYTPIGFRQDFPPEGFNPRFIAASASGQIDSTGHGSLQSGSVAALGASFADATASLRFTISDPAEIDLTCSANALGIAMAFADLFDLTTNQTLLECFQIDGSLTPVTGSGSFLLNNTDLYELYTDANQNDDAAFASLNFNIPGVTEVNVFVPEPSAIYLLGISLIALAFVPKRCNKSKWKRSTRGTPNVSATLMEKILARVEAG
jgi:hypothetical protein